MKREVNQLNVHIIVVFEFFNTPGTEITPRSDVVGENLDGDGIGHLVGSISGEIDLKKR